MPEPEESSVGGGVSGTLVVKEERLQSDVAAGTPVEADGIKNGRVCCQIKNGIGKLHSDGNSPFLETGEAFSDDSQFFSEARSLSSSECEAEETCSFRGEQRNSKAEERGSALSQCRATCPSATPSNYNADELMCSSPGSNTPINCCQELCEVKEVENSTARQSSGIHEEAEHFGRRSCFQQPELVSAVPLMPQTEASESGCCYTPYEETLERSPRAFVSLFQVGTAEKGLDDGSNNTSFENLQPSAAVGEMPLGVEFQESLLRVKDLSNVSDNGGCGTLGVEGHVWLPCVQRWTEACKRVCISELGERGFIVAKGLWKSGVSTAESCLSALSLHPPTQCRAVWSKAKSKFVFQREGLATSDESRRPPLPDSKTDCNGLERRSCPTSKGVEFTTFALNYQRRLLSLYGDILEDVMRLALQVMPVHSSDPRSQSRLLCFQGLFDAFCIYRSYVLGPDVLRGGIEIFRNWKRQGRSNTQMATKLDKRCERLEKNGESVCHALFNSLSLLLKITRSLQLILEIHCYRKRGRQEALKLCLYIEVFKLLLKALLYTLAPFSIYCDDASINHAIAEQKKKLAGLEEEAKKPFCGRRSGRRIPHWVSPPAYRASARSRIVAVTDSWWGMPLAVAPTPPLALFQKLYENFKLQSFQSMSDLYVAGGFKPVVGELLYHLRPFLHLYLLKRAREKSWSPWLLTVCVEAAALSLLHGSPDLMERLSPIETIELHRRLFGMPFALLRPPFFDSILARPFQTLDSVVRRIPVLNCCNVFEVILSYRDFYFATANT